MPIHLRLLRLTPMEAEIELVADREVRGRLMGPSCVYTTTIEVAYHVRGNRVIIPEPAWWDPQSPFLYYGPIEVWRDGLCVETEPVRIGLRHTNMAGNEIVHNGRRVELKSRRIESTDEDTLRRAREAGFNAVEVPAALANECCAIADRIGLFVVPDGPADIDLLRQPSFVRR
jgi:hypothetical protein